MEVKTLYKDEKTVVKVVTYHGEHLYTRTYILDEAVRRNRPTGADEAGHTKHTN